MKNRAEMRELFTLHDSLTMVALCREFSRESVGFYHPCRSSRTMGENHCKCIEVPKPCVCFVVPAHSCLTLERLGLQQGTALCLRHSCSWLASCSFDCFGSSCLASWRSSLFTLRALPGTWKALRKRKTTTAESGDRDSRTKGEPIGIATAARETNLGKTGVTMIYVVSYTLRPKRDATIVILTLQASSGWCHYLDDTWLISTNETPQQLYERVRMAFLTSDSFLIAPFDRYAGYAGWLPKEAWDWIEQHRYL